MIPLSHPCTYPLHKKHRLEPEWIAGDIERVAWCNACITRQKRRKKNANSKFVGHRFNRPPSESSKNETANYLMKTFVVNGINSRNRMARFADHYSPEGHKWCAWGWHYTDEDMKPRGNLLLCPACHPAYRRYLWRQGHGEKPVLTKRQLLIKEVKELRQERSALKKDIVEMKKTLRQLKVLHEELEHKGVDGTKNSRIKIIPVDLPPTAPSKGDRVARSYT